MKFVVVGGVGAAGLWYASHSHDTTTHASGLHGDHYHTAGAPQEGHVGSHPRGGLGDGYIRRVEEVWRHAWPGSGGRLE